VSQKVGNFKFPGRGQRPTPVAFIKDLIEIAWLCPGKQAKEFRRTGAVTLCRALGGDLSLVDEIRVRHGEVSADDRDALLAGTGISAAEANGQAMQAIHPEEHRALKLHNDERALAIFERAGTTMKMLREWAIDETDARHRLFLEDTAMNMFMRYAALVTESGNGAAGAEPRMPLTISGVAADLGFRRLDGGQLAAVGKTAASLYRALHGQGPPKHLQYVDGAPRNVNSYTTEDRDLLEEAVRTTLG
jgi:hypothetical protein